MSTFIPPSVSFPSKDVVCRPADGVDVGKFVLFNYALHALFSAQKACTMLVNFRSSGTVTRHFDSLSFHT